MRFNKIRYNALVILLVMIIGIAITAPMIEWSDLASGEEDQGYIPPIIEQEKPTADGEDRQTYNFKTATAALKQGNINLQQGGFCSVLKGGAELKASYGGIVGVEFRFEADGYKYVNPKNETNFFATTVETRNLPIYKINLDNFYSQVSDKKIISHCVDRTENKENEIVFSLTDFWDRYKFLPAGNWLDFPSSAILSSRIEKFANYQKVTMKVKAEAMNGMGDCLLSPMTVRYDYKVTAPVDVVFYISNYGNILNAQYTLTNEMLLYLPFGTVKSTGVLSFGETFYSADYSEVVQKYEDVVAKYPTLISESKRV